MNLSVDQSDLTDSAMKDPDISLLVAQNQALSAELEQCQADKDFVWSLWKKLQVSNPDVTEAISLTIQREKEKSESKDRKVLEIIQVKDNRIEELQNILAKQAEEISDVLTKKVELTEKSSQLQVENDRLQAVVSSLQSQILREESKDKCLEDTLRRNVENAEKEKYVLNRKVAQLTTDLEVMRSEKVHAVNRQKILEERVRTLEKEVSNKMVKFESLIREVEDSSSRLTLYESQTLQQRRDLEFKNQELENVRRELKELWTAHNQLTEHSGQQADLIRQLQSLQHDTQKMMKNQEDAFCIESSSLQQMFTDVSTRYEAAKRTEADLRQQVLELKKNLMDKEDVISSLQSREEALNSHHTSDSHQRLGVQPEYSSSFLDIVQEVDSVGKLGTSSTRTRGRSLNRLLDLECRNNYDIDLKRSRSFSPPVKDMEAGNELTDVSKAARLQKAFDLKSRQLEEMRRAHDRRLQRFQNLQANYRLTREEMKTLEFSRGTRLRKPKRADPRSLQNENSDQVWNELAFFKAENRTLQVDKISLQEEVDLLRVQACQDVATIHELKMANQTQKEEYEFQLRSLRRDRKEVRETDKQLSLLKSQIRNKTIHVEKLERDMMNAIRQRDDLIQEKSKLISQLTTTQQEASKHRMELADMKHQLQSLRHELKDLRQMSQLDYIAEGKRKISDDDSSNIISTVASNLLRKKKKKIKNTVSEHQKLLHNNAEETSGDNCNDEEWEELSDSEYSESEFESASLGRTIVGCFNVTKTRTKGLQLDSSGKKVKQQRIPTHRPPRLKSTSKFSERAVTLSKSPQWISYSVDHVTRRECATSPIAFLNPSSSSSSPLVSLPAQSSAAPQAQIAGIAATSIHTSRRVVESRQTAALRQRVLRLQQQVALLKKAKMSAVQSEETLIEAVARLKTELSSVQGRLKAAKQHTQKLQTDLEKLQKEKQEVDSSSTPNKTEGNSELPGDGQEVKILETRLKGAMIEASKQTASLKTIKAENESLHEQIKNLHDRINHLERDVTQKRNLLESQKIKLKHAQDVSKADADNVEELQTRNKLLTDSSNKMKVQLDSLKNRLTVIMKEKKEYEDKFIKVSLELDHKTKQLQEASTRRINLESALADLEISAQQQLHGLATQSEAAIDVAREKLTAAQTRLNQFYAMVKILASELVSRVEQTRSKLRDVHLAQEHSQRESDLSLQRAQDKARDILNLSYSDIEDIMSADGDKDSVVAEKTKLDNRWLQKCEKVVNSMDYFVQPLVNLLLQKMDERVELVTQLPY